MTIWYSIVAWHSLEKAGYTKRSHLLLTKADMALETSLAVSLRLILTLSSNFITQLKAALVNYTIRRKS